MAEPMTLPTTLPISELANIPPGPGPPPSVRSMVPGWRRTAVFVLRLRHGSGAPHGRHRRGEAALRRNRPGAAGAAPARISRVLGLLAQPDPRARRGRFPGRRAGLARVR